MSIAFVHGRIAQAMALFTLIAAAYGLVEYFRKQPISSSYWGVIVVGNLLALVQGAIGMFMALNGLQPARGGIHYVYGVVAALWIPIILFINSQFLKPGHQKRTETLICGLISLFEFGIALRAMTTGG